MPTNPLSKESPLWLVLPAHIQQFLDLRHHLSLRVEDIHTEGRLDLAVAVRRRADLVHAGLRDVEMRPHGPAPRADEADARGLVPDDVVAAKGTHQDQHEPRVAHGIQ